MLRLAFLTLLVTVVLRATVADRSLLQSSASQLQSQHPPCMTRQSGWYQCTADTGQSPGALCLPLCIGDDTDGPCQPCSDANKACNTAWSSYGGKLQASLSFNSTDICPQLASKMTTGGTCNCPCASQG